MLNLSGYSSCRMVWFKRKDKLGEASMWLVILSDWTFKKFKQLFFLAIIKHQILFNFGGKLMITYSNRIMSKHDRPI